MNDAIFENKKVRNYDLFYKYQKTNDIEIRNQIFDKYKYMAAIISRKYMNKGIEYDDVYQVACMGLIYAIERFDLEKGFEFTSFATPTILGEIKKHFRDKAWSIKVPRKIQEISKKIHDYNNHLVSQNNKTPTIQELSSYLNASEEDVMEALDAGKMFISQSLDEKLDFNNDDTESSMMDVVGEEDKLFSKIENDDFINKSLNRLNELERLIIIKRFFANKTQINIAKELNISQMTVSRIEKKALEKLKYEFNR